MSQEGALGYAEHGSSYSAILAHYYTGTALGQAPAATIVKVLVGTRVKTLPLESYVRGVVAAEMPASWPLAALEAQAVASRTYAITADAGGSKFDVYSDTRSQMYLGKAAETAATNGAIAATAGQVVTYGGQARDHLLLRELRAVTPKTSSTRSPAPPRSRGWWGWPTPTTRAPSISWTVSMSFAAAGQRLSGLVKGAFAGSKCSSAGSPRGS